MESDNDLFLKLLIGADDLSRKLYLENGNFYPLLFYFKEDKIISSTIFDESFDLDNIDEFLKQSFKDIDTYVLVINDVDKSAFLFISMLKRVRFEDMFIGYKNIDNQSIFSKELLTIDELLDWQKSDF
jgi:hypothetical protein